MLKNRFYVCTKRILTQKLYIFMLLLLLCGTLTYHLLPAQNKEALIRVGICYEEDTPLSGQLTEALLTDSPLYRFHTVDTEEELIRQVKSGYAECGYYFPADFFDAYIAGDTTKPVVQYNLKSSTLSPAVSETLFSHLLQLTAADVLTFFINDPSISTLVHEIASANFTSKDFITVSSVVNGDYKPLSEEKKLNLPVFELLILLTLLSALLSQLIFITDAEEGRYITLSRAEKMSLRFMLALAGLIPLAFFGTLSLLLTDAAASIPAFLAFWLIACPVSILLSCVTKKSISYLKMLPFIVLLTLVVLFIFSLQI